VGIVNTILKTCCSQQYMSISTGVYKVEYQYDVHTAQSAGG
jgi:hypothetical protein